MQPKYHEAMLRSFAILVLVLACATSPDANARSRKTLLKEAEHAWAAATVKAPENEETCFSPDEPCDLKLLKMIESAHASIDMAIYDINLDQLVHELLVQARQIPVRIVVDRKQAKNSHSLVRTLIRGGASVRFGTQRGIMHNKFTIVDGKMVELGSFNYTHHAHQANHENQVYLTSPKVVARYHGRFEKIWREARAPRSDLD